MTGAQVQPMERRGTVYLAYQMHPEQLRTATWSGYWERSPDGPPANLERSPSFASVRDAIRWGRDRSDRVLIRLDEASGYWWAGTSPPRDGLRVDGWIRLTDDQP